MTIYIAADHAGRELGGVLAEFLEREGHAATVLSAPGESSDDDYPDMIAPLAARVASEPGSFGLAIGGSGQGEAMVANRRAGVRAAVFYGPRRAERVLDADGNAADDDYDIVRLARAHNDANVLAIGARFVTDDEAREAVRLFLSTAFSDAPRHARRLAKF